MGVEDAMKVPALIMAGGRGTRMGLALEKPLLQLLGKPLIDWVAEAVANAENVSEFLCCYKCKYAPNREALPK